MKRVLWVSHTLDFRAGGAERVLYDVLKRVDRGEFEALLAVSENSPAAAAPFEALGLPVYALPPLSLTSRRSLRDLLGTAWALLRLHIVFHKLLRREPVDAIYVNSVFALHFVALPARWRKIPLVYHEHGLARDRRGSVWFWFYRRLLRHVTRVVAITDAVRDQVVEFGIADAHAVTIHNGVDLQGTAESSDAGSAQASGEASFRAAQVANFLPWKGHETVVRALSRLRASLPGVRVVFFGESNNERFDAHLAALIEARGVSDLLEFAGFRDDVRALLPDFDCLILASDAEPFGLVILEAMAAGVPVVASNAGGVPEIVSHEENGLLFEAGDDLGLARQLERLAGDVALRDRLVRNGRDTVEHRFSLDAQARAIEALLKSASPS